jgi:hypothetical protein
MNKLVVFMVILFINMNIIIESTNIKVIPLKLTNNPNNNSKQIEEKILKTNDCQYINSNIHSETIYLYFTCKDKDKNIYMKNFKILDKIACIIVIYISIIVFLL